jgi:hypothetical protein
MRRITEASMAAVLILAVATGCGTQGEGRPTQDPEDTPPPLSSTDLPRMKPPAKGPRTPSDLMPTGVVAGRITRGGSGPCYGLITEDGIEYAVYSTAGLVLPDGTYVRVRWEPLTLKVDCGAGRPIHAIEMTMLR